MQDAKGNRSWHTSLEPNQCSYFGEICTYRGVEINPSRRGVRSTRNPALYHSKLKSGIRREQLVTPAINAAYKLIPDEMLVSDKEIVLSQSVDHQIENLNMDELNDFLSRITAEKERRGANA